MRVAVVGNGPSAAGKAAEIDAHDFVVRINWFMAQAAQTSGKKLNAWVFMGNLVDPRDAVPPVGDYELWYIRRPIEMRGLLNVIDVAGVAVDRPIRFLSIGEDARLIKFLQEEPSSGIRAVALAIYTFYENLPIDVYGFDCTVPTAPGWNDANCGNNPIAQPWRTTNIPHNFVGEKALLVKWEAEGKIKWVRN